MDQSTKTKTITFNQLVESYSYNLAIVDPENKGIKFTYQVKHGSNVIASKKPFTIEKLTGNDPYNYELVYTADDFPEQTVGSGTYDYEV